MKLNANVLDALNEQINLELTSAYVYLAMSADFLDKDLKGFANWMQMQAQEEVGHAMRIFHYLDERGARIALQGVEGPPASWDSALAAFEDYQYAAVSCYRPIHEDYDPEVCTAPFLNFQSTHTVNVN